MKSSSTGKAIRSEAGGTLDWHFSRVSADRTFHVLYGRSMYPSRYDEVMSFHEPGLAPAKTGGKWFHIRPDGSKAYSNSYDRVWGFYFGFAAVREGKVSYHISPTGEAAYARKFDWVGNFQDGLCSVRDEKGRYFHITLTGDAAYGETYLYAGDYREGSAVIQQDDGTCTHIDRTGTSVHSRFYAELTPFHKGIAAARDQSGWFHINETGEPIYSKRFASIEPFYNGRSRVLTRDGAIELIDESGSVVTTISESSKTSLDRASHDLVGYWKSFLIKSAIDLGICRLLPQNTQEISRNLDLKYYGAEAFLLALQERGYVYSDDSGTWNLTEMGHALQDAGENGLLYISRLWLDQPYQVWMKLGEIIKNNGDSSVLELFKDRMTSPQSNRDAMKNLQQAMEAYAKLDYAGLTETVNLSGYNTFIDAGGDSDFLLNSILSIYPQARGFRLCRHSCESLENASENVRTRIKILQSNLTEEWKVKGDAIFLAKEISKWPDIIASKIISYSKRALTISGRLYIIDRTLEKNSFSGGLLSLHNFLMTGGRIRKMDEIKKLLEEEGLITHSISKLKSGLSVLVAGRAGDKS